MLTTRKTYMNCRNATTNISILFADPKHIGISHCFYREMPEELSGILSISELFKMSDSEFKSYLTAAYREIPKTHDFNTTYYCDTNEKYCYYNDKSIKSIKVATFTYCNLDKCIMCNTADRKLPLNDEIRLYFFILNKIKNMNLDFINFTTRGEPFFVKKQTFEYLKSLTLNDTKLICFNSNMVLLDEDDISELYNISKSINIPIKMVASCSAITPETYKKIHVNNSFDKVVNNIKLLYKYDMLDFINFVVQFPNLHELEFYKKFWNEHGITEDSKILCTPVIGHDGDKVVQTVEYKRFIDDNRN
jgi:MoaA/NifB/PqqE/SkfB family radical SAM enzyme